MMINAKINQSSIAGLPEESKRVLGALALKLGALNILATFDSYLAGPVVETYYFKLSPSTPLAKIMNTSEDMALATGRESAVVMREGGRIGIQLSRADREIVDFNQCLFALSKELFESKLPILLGKTYKGRYCYLDLVNEPHALVAGSTGSGKSMWLLSAICTLAVTKTPEQVKLIIVDSKQVDLAICSELPHVHKTCRNALELHLALDELLNEMRKRNSAMAGIARNIDEYNAIRRANGERELHRFVLIIDEFADLLAEDYEQAKAKVEPFKSYVRLNDRLRTLAQLSRAAGIHIIAATQRPSVKITGGDLKVNLPCRIAFKLVSQHDSRTVLKTNGAESLLGQGDMLIEPVAKSVFRAHAPFVDLSTLSAILANVGGVRDTLQGVAAMRDGVLVLPGGEDEGAGLSASPNAT